ncbi:MAG: hypothetical protein KC656_00440 [Myxococcales bacterium]|nr:hypothetical protein [Myxococcales bacterium]
MRFLLLGLLACDASTGPHLGGQEGEPVAQPPDEVPDAPPPPAPDPGVDNEGDCRVVAHCEGDGWCADYSEATRPDLEATCPGAWGEGPCDTEGAVGTCAWGSDLCTVVWLWPEASGDVCSN